MRRALPKSSAPAFSHRAVVQEDANPHGRAPDVDDPPDIRPKCIRARRGRARSLREYLFAISGCDHLADPQERGMITAGVDHVPAVVVGH